MSAAVLREAAALMRSRAEAVTSGAQWTDGNYWITDYDPSDPSGQTAMQRLIGGMDAPDHEHYSSWHPAVALAVADWLDGVALYVEAKDDEEYFDLDGDPIAPEDTHAIGSALKVARAYLGSAS